MLIQANNNRAKITFLNGLSQAAEVGISVNDEILAINQLDASAIDFDACLNLGDVGEVIKLTLSRRGRIFEKSICLGKPSNHQICLTRNQENPLGNEWLSVGKIVNDITNPS